MQAVRDRRVLPGPGIARSTVRQQCRTSLSDLLRGQPCCTGRAAMVRAVLEGVAYNNRWLHEAVERFARRRLDSIRVFGGGAQSDLWCQIHADVMGRTIERVADPVHANLRGAAILAGLALGDLDTAAASELIPIAATFRPDPACRALYDGLYAEFPRLYKAQKAMFSRLNGHLRAPSSG